MKWIPVTQDLELPSGAELLALRHRNKFSPERDAVPRGDMIAIIKVARVGDICGKQHPDADRLTWYGWGYQSAVHDPHEAFSHYMLVSDLELPPMPVPTAEEVLEHEKRWAGLRAGHMNFIAALKDIYARLPEKEIGP